MSYRDDFVNAALNRVGNTAVANDCRDWFDTQVKSGHFYGGPNNTYVFNATGHSDGFPPMNGDWCAAFVCWLSYICNLGDSYVPFHAAADEMRQLYVQRGDFVAVNNNNPSAALSQIVHGDLAFIRHPSCSYPDATSSHVTVVRSIASNTVYTVGGNVSNQVAEETYNVSQITGFGKLQSGSIVSPFYIGYLDSVSVSGSYIAGWGYNSINNSPVTVVIIIKKNGNELERKTVLAQSFRSDLQNAGIGNGYHAFHLAYDFQSKGTGVYTVTAYMPVGNFWSKFLTGTHTVYV